LENDSVVIAMNASYGAQKIDIPVQPLNWGEGALSVLYGTLKELPVVAGGYIRELKLAPRSGVILTMKNE
jgi:hypothetical protein